MHDLRDVSDDYGTALSHSLKTHSIRKHDIARTNYFDISQIELFNPILNCLQLKKQMSKLRGEFGQLFREMGMSEFAAICEGVSAGDQNAIDRLCREYGNALRRVAKRRIDQLGLETQLEPDDLFNSAIGAIFLDPGVLADMDPLQIYTYLEQTIKRKAIDKRRRMNARKRGSGRQAKQIDLSTVADYRSTAADEVAMAEQIHLTRAKLTSVERKICMYRADNFSWQEIGDLLQISPAAAQKRYERALNRAKEELHEG